MRTLKSYLLVIGLCLAPATPAALAAAGREPPVPVRTVAPEYPRELKDSGVAGIVTVKVTIDEQGNVSEVEVVKSSNEGFDRFATAALKKWKFKPGKQDGNPVAMQVTIPVKFVVDGS